MLDLKIINGKAFIPGSGFFALEVGVREGTLTMP